MAVTVLDSDITEAEQLLLALIRERYPTIDLGQGSAVRELMLAATAPGLALTLATSRDFANKMSFTSLAELTDAEAAQAADALAANLFVERRSATRSTVRARLFFTSNIGRTIPAGVVFTKDGVSYQFPEANVVTVDTNDLSSTVEGTTTLYYVDYVLEAVNVGATADVTVGTFESTTYTASGFYRADVVSVPVSGVDEETTAELIARIPTALTTRDLVNARAITHSLLQTFPAISNVLVVGMGDAEMVRDVALDQNVSLRFHTGGFVDVYVDSDVETVTETLTVGTEITRPDGLTVMMRVDSGYASILGSLPYNGDFVLSSQGALYLVMAVNAATREIEIYSRTPFPAIDTQSQAFSVGLLGPLYTDLGTMTGKRTNKVTSSDSVTLSGSAYKVRSAWRLRTGAQDLALTLSRTTGTSALVAQTPDMLTRLSSTDLLPSDQVEVTYDRPTQVGDVHAYLNDPLARTAAANVLGRARHPIYVTFSAYYEPAPTTYTAASAAAVLQSALGDAREVCKGDIVKALTGTTCVNVSAMSAQLLAPNGTYVDLSVDAATGKLVLPTGLPEDVTAQTVRYFFDAANITLTEG